MSAFQLGLDRSGNANHWNVTGLTQTDRVIDTPSNNFSVLNNVYRNTSGGPTFTEGNLQTVTPNNGAGISFSTMGVESGKWYAEVYLVAITSLQRTVVGITGDADGTMEANTNIGSLTTSLDVGYFFNGTKFINNSESASAGASYAVGDVMGIALNVDDSEVTFYKNNSSQFTQAFTAGGTYHFAHGDASAGGGSTNVFNFGQDSSFAGRKTPGNKQDGNSIGDFFYAPPAGFLALCTENLPESTITDPGDYFNTVLYTGDGNSTNAITGVGFQPDWVWIKSRGDSASHTLQDVLRGATATIYSQSTEGENANRAYVASFNADGFTTGNAAGASKGPSNADGSTYAAWNWKAGGSGSANTAGSVNSTVSVNTDAGFSIVSWSASNNSHTVGHGLSKAPELIIHKGRSYSGAWHVYTESQGTGKALILDTTQAVQTDSQYFPSVTSTLFQPGSSIAGASSHTYIAYCFHSVQGYSKVGSYTGNGNADGTFVYTGFRPAWLLVKEITDAGERWFMYDNKRDPINFVSKRLVADATNTETDGASQAIDFLSNGWKARASQDAYNTDAKVYIYLAFAETQQKYSNAR